ncbi:MAG: OmpA family protein [Bacteroidota bacterium]
MHPLLLTVLLLVFSFYVAGQTSEEGKINIYKTTRLAEYAFKTENYYAAVNLYLQLHEAEPDNSEISYRLAESYYNLRDYINAGIWYDKTFLLDSLALPLAKFKYASMLKMSGNYNDAITAFTQFYKTYNGINTSYYIKQAKKEIKDCKFALTAVENPLSVSIEHLDTNINGINSDFAPLPFENNKLLFSSIRLPDSLAGKNEQQLVKLYYAKKSDGDNYIFMGLFDAAFNNGKMHTANGAFSEDKKRFYFTLCNTANNSKIICNIYVSEYKNTQWQGPVKLPDLINYPGYSTTQPNYTSNKKNQEVIYYASDRPGGNGGFDIWFTVIKNNNEYAPPKNLGNKINTSGNEITPFYDGNNKILYFSSDGLINLGGLDIFSSKGSLSRWEEPVNLGYPINSSADDFDYVLIEPDYQTTDDGYFVSNRTGSISNNENGTCCDDIYRFRSIDSSGFITTGKEFINTSFSIILLSDTVSKETIINTIASTEQDTTRKDFITSDKIEKKIIYSLKNIYFDFDKATLRPESATELDFLAAQLSQNPCSIIEISGYTDSKGDDEYNLILSQNRANSVVQYLIQKGINKKRLVAKGYGEANPVATNINIDGTDNPNGRQLNRRIEFKIIGELSDSEKN